MNQAKLNLEDAALVCSRNRAELTAGSYLSVTSSPIPSLKSSLIDLLKESNLTLPDLLARSQKPVLPLRFQRRTSYRSSQGACLENKETDVPLWYWETHAGEGSNARAPRGCIYPLVRKLMCAFSIKCVSAVIQTQASAVSKNMWSLLS